MADGEGEAPKKAEAPDLIAALIKVLKKAQIHDGLARGLRECCKALDQRNALLCVLAESCDSPEYVRLIEALCLHHKINLIKVPDAKKLGEWAGLCKLDKDANPIKVVGCSCVVVKDYGEASEELNVIIDYFKKKGGA